MEGFFVLDQTGVQLTLYNFNRSEDIIMVHFHPGLRLNNWVTYESSQFSFFSFELRSLLHFVKFHYVY